MENANQSRTQSFILKEEINTSTLYPWGPSASLGKRGALGRLARNEGRGLERMGVRENYQPVSTELKGTEQNYLLGEQENC